MHRSYLLINLRVLHYSLDPVSQRPCSQRGFVDLSSIKRFRILSHESLHFIGKLYPQAFNVEVKNLIDAGLDEDFHAVPAFVSVAEDIQHSFEYVLDDLRGADIVPQLVYVLFADAPHRFLGCFYDGLNLSEIALNYLLVLLDFSLLNRQELLVLLRLGFANRCLSHGLSDLGK